MTVRLMYARYPGRCARCSERIEVQDRIAYSTVDRKAYHRSCPVLEPEPVRTYVMPKE